LSNIAVNVKKSNIVNLNKSLFAW